MPLRGALFAQISFVLGLCVFTACSGLSAERMEETSDYHLGLAQGHWDGGEVPQAIEEAQLALALDPNNTEAHYLLGFIFSGRNMLPQAIQHYRQALLLEPDSNEAKNNLGVVFLQLERWEEAEELFLELTQVAHYRTPGHAYNNLGWSRYQQGRHREALGDFEMATYLQPDLCLAYNNQGIVLMDLERIPEAVEVLETAIERCPPYAEPHYHLGRILQNEGRYDEAFEMFEECANLVPHAPLGRRCREYLGGRQPSAEWTSY